MEGCFVTDASIHHGHHAPIAVSFEFFPPKSAAMEASLWSAIKKLEPLAPDFVSVTYGAGGSTRERTHATVCRIMTETALKPAAHLTCVAATKDEVDSVIRGYWECGVRHIVALRGDPPEGAGKAYIPHPGGYSNAADLTAGIKRIADFEISVSAYPEKHPESPSFETDLDMLQAKIDAGATRAMTQFFFDNDCYWRFLDRARARGITIPIVPGLIPIHNFKQVASFASRCGASMPAGLADRFDGLSDDLETTQLIASHVAAEQVAHLVEGGVDELHFYTLNRANLVYAICHMLGIKPPHETCAAHQRSEAHP
jgi:methylenetetrahydrofolate reductase (NADPH)